MMRSLLLTTLAATALAGCTPRSNLPTPEVTLRVLTIVSEASYRLGREAAARD